MPKIEEIYWRAECSFAESHKHGMLAEILGVSWPEAVGIVAGLFGQVRRSLPSGDLSKLPPEVLRRWCHSKKITIDALKGAGWVDEDGRIHGWEERYSEIAIRREAARDRQRDKRARDADARDKDVTSSQIVTPVTRHRGITREGEREGEGHQLPTEHVPTGTCVGEAPTAPRNPAKVEAVIQWWNGFTSRTPGLVSCRRLEKPTERARASAAHDAIMAEPGRLEAELSKPWYRGSGKSGWKADLRYVIRPGQVTQLLERADAKPAGDVEVEQAIREHEAERAAREGQK